MSKENIFAVVISFLLLLTSCNPSIQTEVRTNTIIPSPIPSTPSPSHTITATNLPPVLTSTQDIDATRQAEETDLAAAEATYWQLQTTTATPTPAITPIVTIANENNPYGISAEEYIHLSDEILRNLSSFSFTMEFDYYEWFEGSSYVYYLINHHKYLVTNPGSVLQVSEGSNNQIHLMSGEYGESDLFHSEVYVENGTAWCRNEKDDPWNDCTCMPGASLCEDPVSIASLTTIVDAARYSNASDFDNPYDYVSSLFINPNEFLTNNDIESIANPDIVQIIFNVDPNEFYKYINGTTPNALEVVFNRGSVLIDLHTDHYIEMNLQFIYKEPVLDDPANRNNYIEIAFIMNWDEFNQHFNYPDIAQ